MTISSITSSSAASQAAWVSRFDNANSTGAAGQAHRPPPPPDGGAMLGALADALQSIGVTATSAADGGSASGSTDSSSGTTTGDGNVAQALGGFLHELMGALHAQGAAPGGSQSGTPPDGQAYGPPAGPGGAGGPPGGPGRLSSDLQSLISKLGGGTSSTGTDSTGSTDSSDTTDTTSSTGSTSTASSLESSFKNLLQALGADTSTSNDKLTGFLQTLADKLPGAGTSGNLINTTV